MLDGARNTVILPAEILTPTAFFEKKERLEAKSERKRKERQTRIEAGELEIDGYTVAARAKSALENACRDIQAADEGERHGTMLARVMRVYGFVNADVLDDEAAEARLVAAFLDVKPGGESDIRRAIDGARDKADPADLTRYATETGKPPEGLGEPDEVYECSDLEDARANVSEVMDAATNRAGITVVKVPPGVGKSFAAKVRAIANLVDGGKATFAIPTHRLGEETGDDLQDLLADADEVGVAWKAILKDKIKRRSTRGDVISEDADGEKEYLCPQIDEYNKRQKLSPSASLDFCRGCDKHPTNADDESGLCGYWQARETEQGAAVEVTTHHVASFEAERAPKRVEERALVVEWEKLRKACIGSRRVRVWLRETAKEHRITVEEHPDSEIFEALPIGATYDRRARERLILRALGERLDCGGTREEIHRRLIELDRILPDLLIVDESALDAVLSMQKITSTNLEDMRRAGEIKIDAEASQKLRDLIAKSRDGESYQAEDIAEIVPADTIKVCAFGEYPAADDIDLGSEEAVLSARDWKALDGLRESLADGWGGAYISGGVLTVPYIRRVPWQNLARSVVVLDVTATPDSARALFGNEAHFVAIRLKNDHFKTTHVPYGMGTRNMRDGEFWRDKMRDVWAAAHTCWDSPTTLHLTHKAWTNAVKDAPATADALDEMQGAYLHHNGEQARGSNEYRDCDTVVVDSYYCTQNTKAQTAYMLCRLTGDDWSDPETRRRWEYIATTQKEYAPIVQAVHRVRPMLATVEDPVEIIFIDDRDPKVFDPAFEPDEILEPEILVAEELRIFHGETGAKIFLRDLIAQSPQGIILPALLDRLKNPQVLECQGERCSLQAKVGSVLYNPYDTSDDRVKETTIFERLARFQIDHFNGSWRKYADAAELNFSPLENSGGGSIAAIADNLISTASLRSALDEYDHDLRWVAVDGERIDLANVEGELMKALAGIKLAKFERGSVREQLEEVGERLGVSRSTVRRRMKRAGWSTSDLLEEWHEYWYSVFLEEKAKEQRALEAAGVVGRTARPCRTTGQRRGGLTVARCALRRAR